MIEPLTYVLLGVAAASIARMLRYGMGDEMIDLGSGSPYFDVEPGHRRPLWFWGALVNRLRLTGPYWLAAPLGACIPCFTFWVCVACLFLHAYGFGAAVYAAGACGVAHYLSTR